MALDMPLTGNGGTTATVATELISTQHYQYMKLTGSSGSTVAASVLATTPSNTDAGIVTRPIGSTGYTQAAVLVAGSTANVIGAVAVSSGVVLGAGSSANTLGGVSISSGNPVYLGAGSTDTFQYMQSIPFSSGNTSRTSVSTTVDIQIVAASTSRKALVISNRSTAVTIGIGYSTAVLTTALANVDLFLGPSSQLGFGLPGNLPLYLGPLRGLTISSTTVAASVSVIQFT